MTDSNANAFKKLFNNATHVEITISNEGDHIFKAQHGYEKAMEYNRYILDFDEACQDWIGIRVNDNLGQAERPDRFEKQEEQQQIAEVNFNRYEYNHARLKKKDDLLFDQYKEDQGGISSIGYEDPKPECLQDDASVIYLIRSLLEEHPQWAEAFIATQYKGYSQKEYAEFIGVKPGTVSKYCCNAKDVLAEKIVDRRNFYNLLADC